MVLKLPVLDEGGSVLQNRFHPAAPLNQDVWPAAVKYVDASMLDTAPATWQMDDGLWHVIDESVFFLLPQVRACELLFSPKCYYLESILSQNQPEAHTRPRPSHRLLITSWARRSFGTRRASGTSAILRWTSSASRMVATHQSTASRASTAGAGTRCRGSLATYTWRSRRRARGASSSSRSSSARPKRMASNAKVSAATPPSPY